MKPCDKKKYRCRDRNELMSDQDSGKNKQKMVNLKEDQNKKRYQLKFEDGNNQFVVILLKDQNSGRNKRIMEDQ